MLECMKRKLSFLFIHYLDQRLLFHAFFKISSSFMFCTMKNDCFLLVLLQLLYPTSSLWMLINVLQLREWPKYIECYCSRSIDSCCTAYSVDIVIRILRGICLNNKVDILEIDSSWNDISCKENSWLFLEESLDNSLSFPCF